MGICRTRNRQRAKADQPEIGKLLCSRSARLFYRSEMLVEPSDHSMREIQLICITPTKGRVILVCVLRIFDWPPQTAQIHKDFVAQERTNGSIVRTVNDQQRSLYSIQVKDGGVFHVSVPILPRSPAHGTLAFLIERDAIRRSIVVHLTVFSQQISSPVCLEGCSKTLCLCDQTESAVPSIAMSDDPKSFGVSNSHFDQFVHTRHDSL